MESRTGAMEMSVGTMVTIVLLMIVLVLGIFFIQKIFRSGTSAIDNIDTSIQNEINKLFGEEGKLLVIYPTSRQITLKKGDDPRGFAFSIKNDALDSKSFSYSIAADSGFDFTKCGSSFTAAQANSWLVIDSGSFTLAGSAYPELAELILFTIPKTAPECVIPYRIEVTRDGSSYVGASVFVTIK